MQFVLATIVLETELKTELESSLIELKISLIQFLLVRIALISSAIAFLLVTIELESSTIQFLLVTMPIRELINAILTSKN